VNTSLSKVGAITLFVEDLERSKLFYREVFGRPLVFEDDDSAVFGFENTMVNLLHTSAARRLIEPGTVAGRESGSQFQLTIWVDDVDAVCADITTLGVVLLNGPIDREWGQRTISFVDPDGHVWEIAQELTPGDA
jgi:lactoylglutathione lyase